MALEKKGSPNSLGLDGWAQKWDMGDSELLSILMEALPESEREGEERDTKKDAVNLFWNQG